MQHLETHENIKLLRVAQNIQTKCYSISKNRILSLSLMGTSWEKMDDLIQETKKHLGIGHDEQRV